MDDLFNIFINSVVNQYDQRTRPTGNAPTGPTGPTGQTGQTGQTGPTRPAQTVSDLFQLYTFLNETLNEQLDTLDPLNAIRTTDILDPFGQDLSPLETLRAINRTSIRDPFDVNNVNGRNPFDSEQINDPFDVNNVNGRNNNSNARNYFDINNFQEDSEDPSFAVNRNLVDNLHAVRRYYESLARRPINFTQTLSDFILDELNIEVDITDLEDVKVTLTEDQFNLLEKITVIEEKEEKEKKEKKEEKKRKKKKKKNIKINVIFAWMIFVLEIY